MPRTSPITALKFRLAQLRDLLSGRHRAALGHALEAQGEWIRGLQQGLDDLHTAHDAQLADLNRWLSSVIQTVSSISTAPVTPSPELQAIGPRAQRIDEAQIQARFLKIWAVSRWLEQAPVESDALISVIVPTRDRRLHLERAINSVLAQRHANLELVVVNDGSVDDTAAYLASLGDPRLSVLLTEGVGASGARNRGLDAARGGIIAHLDDDNLMDPGWLRAVAWAFDRWPSTEVLYGARIVEDGPARDGVPSGAMPTLEWMAFDRARLEQSNYIDMNVIAHRAGLPEARFDAALTASIEWDLLLKVTATRTPLELPAIACLYSNSAPNRLSDRPNYVAENRRVRSRVHTTRPIRVLSYNALFPLLSETYIEEEMLALEAEGAHIAFASHAPSVSPYPIRQTIYSGLDEGVATENPDVLVVYWTSHALGEFDHLDRVGRPFALRVHSFDFDPERVKRVMNHPKCVGVWAFPHQLPHLPGAHELVPIFTTHARMPEPAAHRTAVASISAGLPKKNWPLLLDAMDQLADLERTIVLARSNGLEHVPDEVVRAAAALRSPPEVRINLPRTEVFDLLSRTSALIYTAAPDLPLGMPMSVIEGLYAGACVVTPDRPEMQALCGEGFRPYRTASDIVAHVREISAGGPQIEEERRRNRTYAIARFCDPELGQRFHRELSEALTAWRARR